MLASTTTSSQVTGHLSLSPPHANRGFGSEGSARHHQRPPQHATTGGERTAPERPGRPGRGHRPRHGQESRPPLPHRRRPRRRRPPRPRRRDRKRPAESVGRHRDPRRAAGQPSALACPARGQPVESHRAGRPRDPSTVIARMVARVLGRPRSSSPPGLPRPGPDPSIRLDSRQARSTAADQPPAASVS